MKARRGLVWACAMAFVIVAMVLGAPVSRAAPASSKCEASWANGELYCMVAPHVIASPNPSLLTSAQILYLAAYPQLAASCDLSNPSTCGPQVLPSGYMPNCNPCFHGDGLNAFPYHDHVLEGAPGDGASGTATVYKGPWVIIIVVYDPTYSSTGTFVPFKSVPDVQSGEQAGDFVAINPGASNPYEINTGVVLICPLVMSNS